MIYFKMNYIPKNLLQNDLHTKNLLQNELHTKKSTWEMKYIKSNELDQNEVHDDDNLVLI